MASGSGANAVCCQEAAAAADCDAVVEAGDVACSREFISANLLKRLRLPLAVSTITVGLMSATCSLMQFCSMLTKKKNESNVSADITEPALFCFGFFEPDVVLGGDECFDGGCGGAYAGALPVPLE